MTHDAVKLLIELGAAAVAMAVVFAILRWRMPARRTGVRSVAGGVIVVLIAISAVTRLHRAASIFSQDRQAGTSAVAGREHCYSESLSGQPVIPGHTFFLQWARSELPSHARYGLAPYSGVPDAWCVTFALLPALPVADPDWTVYVGSAPGAIAARAAAHDPAVTQFAPGYALVRGG